MDAARRLRLVDAMNLGPLWTRRVAAAERMEARVAWFGASFAAPILDRRPDWLIAIDADADDPSFAGPEGKLLDAMLAAAGLVRHDTTGFEEAAGRTPSPRSRMILVCGGSALVALFGPGASLAALRGRAHPRSWQDENVLVVATHHPAHLLRVPLAKGETWADLCLARAACEGASPADQ